MRQGEALIRSAKWMRDVLAAQQSRRHEYPGTTWLDVEIDVMLGEINSDRCKRGLPNISRDVVVQHERMAAGHSDYTSKFGLYCAELAHGISPNHKEIPLERDKTSDERLAEYADIEPTRDVPQEWLDIKEMACELQDLRRMKTELSGAVRLAVLGVLWPAGFRDSREEYADVIAARVVEILEAGK